MLTDMGQSILDLLIPGQSPGIKERLVDLYNKPEILFFGPDGAPVSCHFIDLVSMIHSPEGTADMMDWAARS
jgi:glutamate dehydrogenase